MFFKILKTKNQLSKTETNVTLTFGFSNTKKYLENAGRVSVLKKLLSNQNLEEDYKLKNSGNISFVIL